MFSLPNFLRPLAQFLRWATKIFLLISATWAVIGFASATAVAMLTNLNPFHWYSFVATLEHWSKGDTQFEFNFRLIGASTAIAYFVTGIGLLRFGHEIPLAALVSGPFRWLRANMHPSKVEESDDADDDGWAAWDDEHTSSDAASR